MKTKTSLIFQILIIAIILTTFPLKSVLAQCNPINDSLELVNMYNQWDGENWTNPWNLDTPVSTWSGVTLNEDKCVVELDLFKRELEGELFDINLPALEILILNQNQINGGLPDFQNIPLLEVFQINKNYSLSGEIPDFSNLSNLETLEMSHNQLTGEIPDFSNLPSLRGLILSSTILSGQTPNFSNLPLLQRLYLNGTKLSGEIPDFSNLPILRELGLSSTELTGEIPDFSNLPFLYYLSIGGANLTGPIPDFTNLPSFRLIIGGNSLSGEIPDFSHSNSLQMLEIAGSNIEGEIPDFSNLNNLTYLEIHCENISGQIPNFQFCLSLQNLQIYNSQLIGSIPNFNLPNLEHLTIKYTSLNDTIPNFSNLPNLKILNLGDNNLTGRFPNLASLSNLTHIYLESNHLQDIIPNISTLHNLEVLSVFNNQLKGILPNFLQNPNLTRLKLGYNSIQGIIPNFENNPLLWELDLRHNNFDSCAVAYHQISSFAIGYNRLTMDDIIPNLALNPEMYYGPLQSPFLVNPSIYFDQDGFMLVIDIDEDTQGNTFMWWKNGISLGTTNSNQIILSEISPEDKFVVYISNENAPSIGVIWSEVFKIENVKPILKGSIFKDTNFNCESDTEENGLRYWDLKLTGASTYYTRTDTNGYFKMLCDTGQYTLEVLLPNNSWQVCSGNYSFDFNFLDTVEINIPVQAFEDCAELSVNLGVESPFLRRCFQNRFVANYCNMGTALSTDIKIQLKFDPWIIVDSMNMNFALLGNGLFEIEVDSLDIGECKSLQVFVTTNCDAPLNISQGVTAHIYPDTLCSPLTSEWSGATIDVTGNCLDNEIQFIIRNTGLEATNDSIHYRIFRDGSLVESEWVQLPAGANFIITKLAEGASWRLESEQGG